MNSALQRTRRIGPHILERNGLPAENNQPFHHVAQLADIAAPFHLPELFDRPGLDRLGLYAVLLADLPDEVIDQQRNVPARSRSAGTRMTITLRR